MPATPIYATISTLRAAIYSALSSVAPTALHSDGLTRAKLYWWQAEEGIGLPFAIYQPQDGGGAATKHVGDFGWEGLVTLRALDYTQAGADSLLATLAPRMETLAAAAYGFTVTYERPLTLPPDEFGIFQSGHIWRVAIGA